jgi:hypothetical protein
LILVRVAARWLAGWRVGRRRSQSVRAQQELVEARAELARLRGRTGDVVEAEAQARFAVEAAEAGELTSPAAPDDSGEQSGWTLRRRARR